MRNPQNYPELPLWSVMNWGKYPNMGYMHVNSMVGVCVCVCVYVCIFRCWKIIEYETRKKRWNRLSSLEKLYSLYHILTHSHCHMKDALAGGKTNGRQLSSALHLLN